MNTTKRLIASLLIASITLMGLPLTANAGIVSTDTTLTASAAEANRDRVTSFLARADVRAAMEARGVDSANATERVRSSSTSGPSEPRSDSSSRTRPEKWWRNCR